MFKYLYIVMVIYTLVLIGLLNSKKHYIIMLVAFELFLVFVGLMIGIMGILRDDLVGTTSSVFLLTMGAAESAISLILVVLLYKLNGSILVDVVYKLVENDYFFKA